MPWVAFFLGLSANVVQRQFADALGITFAQRRKIKDFAGYDLCQGIGSIDQVKLMPGGVVGRCHCPHCTVIEGRLLQKLLFGVQF